MTEQPNDHETAHWTSSKKPPPQKLREDEVTEEAAAEGLDQPDPSAESTPASVDAPIEEPVKEPTEEPIEEPADLGFAGLGLRSEIVESLAALGYEEPTPIQRESIPHLLAGEDLLGQAATGTGKTAAFALPVLHAIGPEAPAVPTALIVVPTRELAVQVSEAMFKYGTRMGIKVLPVFGGQPIYRQIKSLERGTHVVVATPGRAIDLINRGSLKLGSIRTVILDEADEMLDMGFTEDIEAILQSTPDDRQTVLFSATMPSRIKSIAKRYQNNPTRIEIGKGNSDDTKALIRQTVYFVQRNHKASALGRILDIEGPTSAIVFCKTRTEVDELTVTMNGRGYRAEALHGGMDQNQRDRVMSRLRDGTAELLVATDVAARGLDVDTLTHVVNYDVPSAAESYVHRIGRVGRAGREGVAITLAEPRQKRLLGNSERLTKQKIPVEKVPSVADLRERQVEITVGSLTEALMSDDLEDYLGVLDKLDEHALRNVALAAIKLAHEAGGATLDEIEIPDASTKGGRDYNDRDRDKRRGKDRDRGRDRHDSSGRPTRGKGATRGERPAPEDTSFVHFNVGRKAGVRPGDLVGAIANECGLPGSDVGPIRISDGYSVVGVPNTDLQDVIRTMKSSSVRGKKIQAREYKS